ncbi:MAG TPA: hypothetical protein VEC12_12820 [Bacteroidia bacterium]|nr:hypothetical protein [Bacteroidia bacterium]
MKKIITVVVFIAITITTHACDVCGCRAGNDGLGILPRFNRHFVGVRYNYSPFRSQHLTLFENEVPIHSEEKFHTYTVWGRYVPHQRVQVFAFLPYNSVIQHIEGKTNRIEGFGDAVLMANYVLFNTTDSMQKGRLKHALQAGGGVKLPTGASDIKQDGLLINPNLQPGTGATDVLLNMLYTVRIKKFGINAEASYTLRTENANYYKFGNRFSGGLRGYYRKTFGVTTLLPSVAATYDFADLDSDLGKKIDYTGTKMLSASGGLDVYYKSFAVSTGIKIPLAGTMGGSYITQKTSYSASIIYLF